MASSCIYTEQIFAGSTARSLAWSGDDLVDWAGGNVRYHADGAVSSPSVNYPYSFDAAITEPSGEFAVIYAKLGTKALLLRKGKVIRELNRNSYHADAYEYPIVLVRRKGRVLLVHCPHAYNKLEIEDAISGEPLTIRTSDSSDFFHSRLAASPSGRYLLSAGWFWHPWDAVAYYDLDVALHHPEHLDTLGWNAATSGMVGLTEENSACWHSEGEVLLSGSSESKDAVDANEFSGERLKPGGLAFYKVRERATRSACVLDEPAGTMMPIGLSHVMAFYKHPRLIRLSDGFVEFSLPWISSGVQLSSIIHHHSLPPPLAFDPERCRFGIAQGDKVHVISVAL